MKRNRSFCRIFCCLLCAVLLAACAAGEPAADESVPAAQPLASEEKEAVVDMDHALGMGAIRADAQLDLLLDDIEYYKTALGGDKLWVWGNARGTDDPAIASVSMDGTPGQVLTLQFPALDAQLQVAAEEAGALGRMFYELHDSAGEFPLLVRDWHTVPDEEHWQERSDRRMWLCGVDAQGNVSEGVELDIEDGEFSTLGIRDGIIWLRAYAEDPAYGTYTEKALYGFDTADGTLKKRYEFAPGLLLANLCPLEENRVLAHVYEMDPADPGRMSDNAQRLLEIGFEEGAGRLIRTVKPPLPATSCMQFVNTVQGEDILLWSNTGLFRWDMEENTYTLLHDAVDVGINDMPGKVYCINGKDFYLTVGHVSVQKNTRKVKFEVWLLGDEAAIPADDRPVITVGVLASAKAKLHPAVDAFNKASPDLRVEMVDYTPAAAKAAGLETAQELLNRDILQGTAPDIISGLYGADLRQLVGKGAIMDLYPMLDADAELSREDFAAGPLSAGTVDGGLYGIITEYSILTTVGSAGKLGEETGWSMDEFAALTAGMPTPYYGFGRDTLLWYQFQAGADRYIDYAAGKAHLDTPEFAAMLEGFAAYPETMGLHVSEDLKPVFDAGKAAAAVCVVSNFDGVKNDVYTFNGPVTYKGFAGAAGSGGLLSPGVQLSICSAAKDPQAAWRFVRYLLSAEYQSQLSSILPLRRDALAAAAREAQQPYVDLIPNDGIIYGIPSYLDQRTTNQNIIDYWTRGLTPEEADKIVALAENTSVPFLFDDVVMGILKEEASAFFAGARTAEDAAAIMQNRIQTYLDEQG
ncbi:MAG: extracellular solute-binding protein [Oscillospiraceae bacterium]|nr:extracellular solute-binding protein [Oscillospiraceae bacterium]